MINFWRTSTSNDSLSIYDFTVINLLQSQINVKGYGRKFCSASCWSCKPTFLVARCWFFHFLRNCFAFATYPTHLALCLDLTLHAILHTALHWLIWVYIFGLFAADFSFLRNCFAFCYKPYIIGSVPGFNLTTNTADIKVSQGIWRSDRTHKRWARWWNWLVLNGRDGIYFTLHILSRFGSENVTGIWTNFGEWEKLGCGEMREWQVRNKMLCWKLQGYRYTFVRSISEATS